jgi:putative chitinase
MIDVARLVAAGVAPTQARAFAEPLRAACALWGIDTPVRVAAFLAQAMHESARLTRLEESLYYTTPERIRAIWPTRVNSLDLAARLTRSPERLANLVYANRNGNGDVNSGDGWAFRGRGIFQLTGRANYTAAQVACNRPWVAEPWRVAEPSDACMSAAWYWHSNALNSLADTMQVDKITRAINGPAMLAAAERRQMTEEAARAFA